MPNRGFCACHTIYNFYPNNSQGILLKVRSECTFDAFSGALIGLGYDYYSVAPGVETHDYEVAVDGCRDYDGLLPFGRTISNQYITVALTVTPKPTPTAQTGVPTVRSGNNNPDYFKTEIIPAVVTFTGTTFTTEIVNTETPTVEIPGGVTTVGTTWTNLNTIIITKILPSVFHTTFIETDVIISTFTRTSSIYATTQLVTVIETTIRMKNEGNSITMIINVHAIMTTTTNYTTTQTMGPPTPYIIVDGGDINN
ncbi:hypothetical protein BDA99DRAFT_532677 [Phascolomyces articulosus]|uniref:Uncharacterized protein n=1 Tax=Phascolomyces articulosus TaxID=60185 RepID=A0AAD5K9R1_9FUNG|nr:hypothetical protein BDA99DRAFT_532677 [Phascolomyces articulosus]